jgi:hypothetical protein
VYGVENENVVLVLFCAVMARAGLSLALALGRVRLSALSVPLWDVLVTIVERGLAPPADDSLRVYETDIDWAGRPCAPWDLLGGCAGSAVCCCGGRGG